MAGELALEQLRGRARGQFLWRALSSTTARIAYVAIVFSSVADVRVGGMHMSLGWCRARGDESMGFLIRVLPPGKTKRHWDGEISGGSARLLQYPTFCAPRARSIR